MTRPEIIRAAGQVHGYILTRGRHSDGTLYLWWLANLEYLATRGDWCTEPLWAIRLAIRMLVDDEVLILHAIGDPRPHYGLGPAADDWMPPDPETKSAGKGEKGVGDESASGLTGRHTGPEIASHYGFPKKAMDNQLRGFRTGSQDLVGKAWFPEDESAGCKYSYLVDHPTELVSQPKKR